jgi:hypothetical protein
LAIQGGLGVEVEVLQPPRGGQGGEAEPPLEPALLGGPELEGEQTLQEGGVAELLLAGLLELGREGFGGGLQTEVVEVTAQLLVEALLGHRAASASKA